eukprot:134581-Pyramimonas_sp.AAC.1
MSTFPLTIGSYNPMQSASLDRLTDIADCTKNFDGIALIGTRSKATRGTTLRKRQVGNRVVIEAGWTTECTPSLIGGRGLLCRARSGRYDVTIIALYFPPKPKYSHEWTRYRRTVNELIAWLAPRLASLPQRTTPFVCADVNDGMGLIQMNGQWVSDELMVVRPENATRG